MSIWTYDGNVRDVESISAAVAMTECVYCKTSLEILRSENLEFENGEQEIELIIRCCPACGWWTKFERDYQGKWIDRAGVFPFELHWGAVGSLRELDIQDQSMPMEDIRAYLAAKYDSRFDIDPWKFEEAVASVYRDLGYEARVTTRSKDGGIDVILDGPEESVIGVQVKRHRRKISVEQIRSLAGALILGGMTRGIFVTTSTFQSGAKPTAERFRLRGMPIELVDAQRFYDALGLAQRTSYQSISDPTAPFSQVASMGIYSKIAGNMPVRYGIK